MGESTPEQPNGPKGPNFAGAFAASVRQPGERSTLTGRIVTAGVVVVLTGAAAVGIGALVVHQPGQAKTLNAADTRRPPSASPVASPNPSHPVKRHPAPTRTVYVRPQPGTDNADVAPHTPARAPHSDSKNHVLHVAARPARHFVGAQSKLCIDVTGRNGTAGTPLQIWLCHDIPGQNWKQESDGTMRAMGLCMAVAGGSHENGAPIQLANCNGGPAQQFVANSAGDLVNRGADKCVEVKNHGTKNGTRLQLWDCVGTSNQRWRA